MIVCKLLERKGVPVRSSQSWSGISEGLFGSESEMESGGLLERKPRSEKPERLREARSASKWEDVKWSCVRDGCETSRRG